MLNKDLLLFVYHIFINATIIDMQTLNNELLYVLPHLCKPEEIFCEYGAGRDKY